MSVPFVLPFNNNPQSTLIVGGSYTVPSGKFAKVRELSMGLTVDGIEIATVVYTFTRVLTSGIQTDRVGAPYDFDFIRFTSSSTGSSTGNVSQLDRATVSLSTSVDPTISATGFVLFSNQVASFIGTKVNYAKVINYNGTLATAGFSISTIRSNGTVTSKLDLFINDTKDFFVPSGTVLNGLRYLVMEYNSK